MIIDSRAASYRCCYPIILFQDENSEKIKSHVYCTAATDDDDPFLCIEHRSVVTPPRLPDRNIERIRRRNQKAERRRDRRTVALIRGLTDVVI